MQLSRDTMAPLSGLHTFCVTGLFSAWFSLETESQLTPRGLDHLDSLGSPTTKAPPESTSLSSGVQAFAFFLSLFLIIYLFCICFLAQLPQLFSKSYQSAGNLRRKPYSGQRDVLCRQSAVLAHQQSPCAGRKTRKRKE